MSISEGISNREKKISIVLIITLALNIVSASVKIWAGEEYNFFVLVTSGVESLFDGTSNILALISLYIAAKPADSKHHYGHQKYETVASFLIAVLLLFSSYEMGKEVFHKSMLPLQAVVEFPQVPLLSLGFSMAISLFVTLYESNRGKQLDSPVLLADAHHTMGDFLISFAVALSMILTYWGIAWVDLAVGALICLYLIYLALKILKMNIDELVDATPFIKSKEIFEEVKELKFVHDIHEIRARGSSRQLYLDFHLLLQDDLPLKIAHEIGHEAEAMIKKELSKYAARVDITVHIEPHQGHHEDH